MDVCNKDSLSLAVTFSPIKRWGHNAANTHSDCYSKPGLTEWKTTAAAPSLPKGQSFFLFFLIPPSASCFLLCMCTFGGGHREVRAGYRILMKWSGLSLEEGLFFIRNPLNLIGILHMKWYTVGFKFIPFTVFSFTTQKKMKNNYEVPNHTTVASSCFIL